MYARLWWKETRVFWPIWIALGVVAAGVQWFLLWSKVEAAQRGLLIVIGLGWSVLNAFAVGAGVFAAEREANTQVFLDTLPVGRKMLWTSKVSFALGTTVGLALALAALGALGTTQRDPSEYPKEMLLQGIGILLLEAVAWSLLWSVMLGSALQAAVAGMGTVSLLNVLLSLRPGVRYSMVWSAFPGARLQLAGVALLVSWVVFTRAPRRGRSSSVVMGLAAQPGPRFGRLVWETLRESWRTWLLLTVAWGGLMLALWLALTRESNRPDEPWIAFGFLTGVLAAGVSVFGPANRTRNYRFLAYHGVSPGLVWTAKLTVWSVFMTALVLVSAVALFLGTRRSDQELLQLLAAGGPVIEAFVIAVLAGQVLKRSITAWVVAFLAVLLVALAQLGLSVAKMVPMASLVLLPLLLLAISRAWASDWMNDLRGIARWVRLAAMLGSTAVLLVALYVGYRAWSVPDVGSPFPLRPAALSPAAIAPDQDAALDYTRILAELKALDHAANSGITADESKERLPTPEDLVQFVRSSGQANLKPAVAWWNARRALIEPIRQAAAKPEARFPSRVFFSSGVDSRIEELRSVVVLLGVDNFQRRSGRDLAGAWDDILTVFRMAAQIDRTHGFVETIHALRWRTQALEWALAWAGDPRQTPAQLRSALTDFRTLPKLVPPAVILEAEYRLDERTLRREPEVLVNMLVGDSIQWSLLRKLVTPWWERERAVRVLRLDFARQLRLAALEPWQQPSDERIRRAELDWYVESTPLFRPLAAFSTYGRHTPTLLSRAFEQVAALRVWQLEHDGHYPETLEALVPGLLPSLPRDPYSGGPFGYRRADHSSEGAPVVLPLGLGGMTVPNPGQLEGSLLQALEFTQQGQWLLYSVGPDEFDNGARIDYRPVPTESDLVFPLPPS
jgi:hypothetical protein